MIRQIIKIDSHKCNSCGLCVKACHEGAIQLVNGKAALIRDDYCDGLGDCLPACPTGAITFEQREAADYDESAVQQHLARKRGENSTGTVNPMPFGCPGTHAKTLERTSAAPLSTTAAPSAPVLSQLGSWPIQIKLVPPEAPYFQNANLLIAADCTAFAYGNFHQELMKNKITIIGCPKLDEGNYADKLASIIRLNDLKSITVVRMEVPCCGGLVNATMEAIKRSGKVQPWRVVTISIDGRIIED